MEAPITIKGTAVISPKNEVFEFRDHVSAIGNLLHKLEEKDKSLLVFVTGKSGSGKSMLAQVLANTGHNCEYIDCLKLEEETADFSTLLKDSKKTYLVDSPEFINDSIWVAIKYHAGRNGRCVCFIQNERDIGLHADYALYKLAGMFNGY